MSSDVLCWYLFAFVRDRVSLELAILAMLTGQHGQESLLSAPSRAGIIDCVSFDMDAGILW